MSPSGFQINLLMLILPVAAAGAILVFAGGRGVSVFKKQGVAWGLTALMVVAAVGIGFAKAPAGSPTPDRPQSSPSGGETVPPGLQQGPGTLPSYVRDDAGALSDRTERELYERNQRLYERYGAVIAVVTCNDRGDLGSYALEQIGEMGLGARDMIVVLDIRGDNYLFVGLEGYFTDEDCSDYAYRYMEQAFAGGDYDSAALKLTQALEDWYGSHFR